MDVTEGFVERLERELVAGITRRQRTRTIVARSGAAAALAAAAVLVAVVVPRTGSSPVLASDIKGQLSETPAVIAFVVTSSRPSYWRLAALSEFDGATWGLSVESRSGGGPDPQLSNPGVDTGTFTQTFEIRGLTGSLLPVAPEPISASAGSARFEADSSSLVVSADSITGRRYTVESAFAIASPAVLRSADARPDDIDVERYLELPSAFPPELEDVARDVTAGAATRYDAAIALQTWFRSFTYDENVPAGVSVDAMSHFIDVRRGFSEHFASTFAALARVIGLPARVAVGFTPGEQRADGLYYVEGRHAHAWPEVYFDGIGWIRFEPTPGRGGASPHECHTVGSARPGGDERG